MTVQSAFCDVHSSQICEDGATLAVWLIRRDGALCSLNLSLDECQRRATMIEPSPTDNAEPAARFAATLRDALNRALICHVVRPIRRALALTAAGYAALAALALLVRYV